MQICACTFTPLPLLPVLFEYVYVLAPCEWEFACILTVFTSVYEHFIAAITTCVFMRTRYLVWSESLSWCQGMNGIFWDRSVLLCVCQTCCASIAHTRKATSPRLLLSTMPENSSDYAGHSGVRTRAVLSYFFFYFFLTGLWIFAPTTLKSILYLLGYKSFLWTQKVFRECACRVSDVRTFLYHLSHWFSATLVAYVLLNAKRVT